MSGITKFPIVTIIMICITGLFIFMYMVTSSVFFYSNDSIKVKLDDSANRSMSEPMYRNAYLNNSEQQKMFYQYGMVTSVVLCPVIAILELTGNKKQQGE